jgi:hypothetical protein
LVSPGRTTSTSLWTLTMFLGALPLRQPRSSFGVVRFRRTRSSFSLSSREGGLAWARSLGASITDTSLCPDAIGRWQGPCESLMLAYQPISIKQSVKILGRLLGNSGLRHPQQASVSRERAAMGTRRDSWHARLFQRDRVVSSCQVSL